MSARTSADVAQYLHAQGHEVLVACPTPTRNVAAEGLDEKIAGLNMPFPVSRLFAFSSKKSSFVSRFLENISFGLSVFFFILRQRKVDVIYANVWPLFSLGLLLMAARLKGIKVVASVQDLYPESLAVQKRIEETGGIYRGLLKLDTLIARNCDHLVVISDGFHRAYTETRKIDPSKVTLVRNWVQGSQIQALPKEQAREELEKVMGLRLAPEQFFSCMAAIWASLPAWMSSWVIWMASIHGQCSCLQVTDRWCRSSSGCYRPAVWSPVATSFRLGRSN
nr:glycosyltransferase family 4 protein [Pseudomonas sp. BIGb0427]